ncbi:hypothetical protein OG735_36705 [Streptomyces sp. NBC_01210]|uniref:hypothetical protein n=1 Tax=Streptomyces sp. NBC_01210 TaxID=2903774 RepID=UPI002E1300F5|nr:hypothetical protein OG735_36705 [Streptomyces sp. NBC_01210]
MFMMTFLQEFESWYWNCEFDDPELTAAYDATGTATTPEEFEQAFLVLLRSNDTVARGTALDFYDRAGATSRFGEESPFDAHTDEVLAVARELLRQPPRPEDEYTFEGANHASALLGLKNAAGPQDTDAIVGILERFLERTPDTNLHDNALVVAGVVLKSSAVPDPRLVELVGGLVFDRSSDCDDRLAALGALREAPGAEVTALLVRATGEDEWKIRQEAAWALTVGGRFYAHRELLEGLIETWPDGERSWWGDLARQALAEGPHSLYWEGHEPETEELRAAHRELRSPTDEAAHRSAYRTMLHSGQPVAVGIALDHFHQDDGLTRFGLDAREWAPEVLAVARDVLGHPGAGANHASALHLLEEIAEPADAEALAAALRTRGGAKAARERAVQTAKSCLTRWEAPDDRVIAALEGFIHDASLDVDERSEAVIALFDLPTAPQATAVLVRATRSPELPIQVEAAIGLTFEHLIDDHRERLERLVATWPQEAGNRATIVRFDLGE